MKFSITTLEDFDYYLGTSMEKVDGVPSTDQYSFDINTGIAQVNAGGQKPFGLYVPITNLKIGDKIKATVDIKLIGGASRPQLSTSLMKGPVGSWGDIGPQRLQVFHSNLTDDFETVTLDFVYQGFVNTTGFPVSATNNGFETVRLFIPAGYGASIFAFKNLTIEVGHNSGGLYPGSKIYHGLIKFIPGEGFSFEKDGGSHNFDKMSISNNTHNNYFILNLGETFLGQVTALSDTMLQMGSNNYKYDIRVNTTTASSVTFIAYDIVTKAPVNISDITIPIYIPFLIIGE